MSIDTLHKLCALKRLAELPLLITGHEMVITVDTVDAFGMKKTGEELATEIWRAAVHRVYEEELGAEPWSGSQ